MLSECLDRRSGGKKLPKDVDFSFDRAEKITKIVFNINIVV